MNGCFQFDIWEICDCQNIDDILGLIGMIIIELFVDYGFDSVLGVIVVNYIFGLYLFNFFFMVFVGLFDYCCDRMWVVGFMFN